MNENIVRMMYVGAGLEVGANAVSENALTRFCAGCGVAVLPRAPVVALHPTPAMLHAGSDWHPGCWAAHLLRGPTDLAEEPTSREYLARARGLLQRSDRRSA